MSYQFSFLDNLSKYLMGFTDDLSYLFGVARQGLECPLTLKCNFLMYKLSQSSDEHPILKLLLIPKAKLKLFDLQRD